MKLKLMRSCFYIVLPMVIIISGCAVPHAPNLLKGDAYKQDLSVEAAAEKRQIKTIGIIGGVSWASSIEYYRLMNEIVRDRLGGVNSAQILLFSIEFGEFSKQERLADKGDWTLMTQTMLDAAQRLKRGGADFIVIASNTLNSLAGIIEQKVGLPVLHIADATGVQSRLIIALSGAQPRRSTASCFASGLRAALRAAQQSAGASRDLIPMREARSGQPARSAQLAVRRRERNEQENNHNHRHRRFLPRPNDRSPLRRQTSIA